MALLLNLALNYTIEIIYPKIRQLNTFTVFNDVQGSLLPFQARARLLMFPSRTLISQRSITSIHFCGHAVVRLCRRGKQSVCHAVRYDAAYDKIVR